MRQMRLYRVAVRKLAVPAEQNPLPEGSPPLPRAVESYWVASNTGVNAAACALAVAKKEFGDQLDLVGVDAKQDRVLVDV